MGNKTIMQFKKAANYRNRVEDRQYQLDQLIKKTSYNSDLDFLGLKKTDLDESASRER